MKTVPAKTLIVVVAVFLGMVSAGKVQATDVDLAPFGQPGWIAQVDDFIVSPSDIKVGGTTLRTGVPTITISPFLGAGFTSTPHKFTPFADIHFVHVSDAQQFRATVTLEVFNASISDYAGIDISLINARLTPDLNASLTIKDLVNGHPHYAHIHPDNTPVDTITSLINATDCDTANQTAFAPSFQQATAIVPFNPVSSIECLIPGPFGATFTAPPSAIHVIQDIPAFGPESTAVFNGLGFHQFIEPDGRSSDFILRLAAVIKEPGTAGATTSFNSSQFDHQLGKAGATTSRPSSPFDVFRTKEDRPNPRLEELQEGPQPPASREGGLGWKLWKYVGLDKLRPASVDANNPAVAEFVNRLAGTDIGLCATPTQVADARLRR